MTQGASSSSPVPPVSATQPDQMAASGVAWVEGEYMSTSEARIPIFDTGFLESNCTFDVVGVWDGAFFRLGDHLDRLARGCERLRIDPAPSRERMREVMFEMVRRSGLRRAYVATIVTRGVSSLGKERDSRRLSAALYGFTIPYQWILPEAELETGLNMVIAQSATRIPSTAVDPTIKNFQRGDFSRGQLEARDRGASFCMLTDGNGLLTEGEGMNLFAILDGTLYTPSDGCLLGITRRTAIEIAEEAEVPVVVGDLPVELALRADEIFGTSTAGGIMAIATVDGRPVGSGKEGPLTRRIRDRYWELHSDPNHTDAADYDAPYTG